MLLEYYKRQCQIKFCSEIETEAEEKNHLLLISSKKIPVTQKKKIINQKGGTLLGLLLNRREGNDQESIQLSHTSHQRHQRERNTNTK